MNLQGTQLRIVVLLSLLAHRTVSQDSNWDDRFGVPGVDGIGTAIAFRGNEVYLGGRFTSAGGVAATNIARWDGTNWSAFGSGINGWVSAIVVQESDLLVAGSFSQAGGVNASNIARWDGVSWSSLGTGLNGPVSALAIIGSDVFVVGAFSSAGGVTVSNVAKWDGSKWADVAGGLNGGATAACAVGTDLYVGGQFSRAGAVSATNMARWDGVNWSALGSTPVGVPGAIRASGSDVFTFSLIGYTGFLISKWDGAAWSTAAFGECALPCFDCSATADDLVIADDGIYITGLFTGINGIPAAGIARWDGVRWSNVGGGLPRYSPWSTKLALSGKSLYAAGDFSMAGGISARGVACWNGTNWTGLGPGIGLPQQVRAMARSGNSVYVGSVFQSATNAGVGALGRWDGTNWTAVDASLGSPTNLITIWGIAANATSLYAIAAENQVVQWDGQKWVTLGIAGAPRLTYFPQLYTLALDGANLYTGGMFDWISQDGSRSGGGSAIAMWDGNNWSSLDTLGRSNYPPYVSAIAAGTNVLYVGGAFTSAGGVVANSIAAWSSTNWWGNWTGLSSGVFQPYPDAGGVVNALALIGSDLYAGGVFISAGGVNATNIGKWDGTNWSALAGGVDGAVSCLVANGADLYVGGTFTHAGGVAARNIAKWDGTNWTSLGSGVGSEPYYGYNGVNALAVNGSELFVGGSFTSAGGKPSNNFAIWHIPQSLRISLVAGNQFRLAWPVTGRDFSLEASDTLQDWHFVAAPVLIEGTECVVTNAASNISRFYRLRR